MKKILEKYQDHAWLVFRVIFGAIFTIHGLQKFGVFGGTPLTPAAGLFFLAGIFEIIVGPLIILGLATRIAAIFGAVEMAVAIVQVHWKYNPIANWNPLGPTGGEPAWMNLAAFIALAAYGAGKWALDQKVLKDWA